VDLEEWMNEEVKRLEENVYPLLGRVKKKERNISTGFCARVQEDPQGKYVWPMAASRQH
jgi:hypothetical protein